MVHCPVATRTLRWNDHGRRQEERSRRVLFDGTNRNDVNTSTSGPGASTSRRGLEEVHSGKTLEEVTFGLTADVKEVNRQVPIHRNDWHML